MIRTKRGIAIWGIVLLALPVFSQSVHWKVDTLKTTIKFVTTGPLGEVDGTLSGLIATIIFDEKEPSTGSMVATVNPNTISTGVGLRNTHLKEKEEFFNTAKYPLIYFKSKEIKKTPTGYVVIGDLKIKDVTKQIEIPFTFEKTSTGATFKGQFTIDSHDYTVNDSKKNVTIYLEVPVTK